MFFKNERLLDRGIWKISSNSHITLWRAMAVVIKCVFMHEENPLTGLLEMVSHCVVGLWLYIYSKMHYKEACHNLKAKRYVFKGHDCVRCWNRLGRPFVSPPVLAHKLSTRPLALHKQPHPHSWFLYTTSIRKK